MYDVYGIGNALVDIEYEVTANRLEELGIDKGVMTLVDSDRQLNVMRELDHYTRHRACGGSAANSMIAVSQFGGSAFYSCRVADDAVGTFFLEDLLGHGVATNLTANGRETGVTGTCLVFVTPDADRTMNTHLGISADLGRKELSEKALLASRYLYIEGYLAASASAVEGVRRAREVIDGADTTVALTLSDPNMVDFFREGLESMIGDGVDLLFCNESEACKMASSDSLNDAVEALKHLSREFVITRGARGALVFDGKELAEVPGVAVDAVDTVGAGDMFAGAFLYGVSQGRSHKDAAVLASGAAARLVTEFGPRLDNDSVRAVREHYEGS